MNKQPASNEIVGFGKDEAVMRERLDDINIALEDILDEGQKFKERLENVQKEQDPKTFYLKTKRLYDNMYNFIACNRNVNEEVEIFRSVLEQEYSKEYDNE